MFPLFAIAIVVLVALAAFMAAAAWKLLRADRERSAARVAALDELARRTDDEDERVEVVHAPRRMSDREHDAALEDNWDFEFRPAMEPGADEPEVEDAVIATPAPEPIPVAVPLPLPEPVIRRNTAPRVPDRRRARAAVAVADGMFGSATGTPRRSGHQLWTAAATAIVVLALGTGMVYAVRHADSIAGLGRRLTTTRPAAQTMPLELVSLRHADDGSGTFTVTGFVQNPGEGTPTSNVVAVVYLFDAEGEYFATGRAPLDVKSLGPGDESPFVVTIPRAPGVSRYRVGFRTDTGDVVAHVDRRGREPRGGPGDVVNGVDRNPEPPSAPRRVEG